MRLLYFSLFTILVHGGVLQVPLPYEPKEIDDGTANFVAWDVLNTTIGGKLHYNLPVASPCYPEDGGCGPRDRKACHRVLDNKQDNLFIANQSSGYYFSNWASCQATGESCALPLDKDGKIGNVSATAKCKQGNLPTRYIEVRNESDIVAGLKFARENHVAVVVKNSGHDWKGRSAAPGALALWTHHLRKQMVLEENFVPKECLKPVGEVITFAAGEQWKDVYAFAKEKGRMVIGGTCPSVGPAGWLAGGGHSPLSPVYGMGVDNIQQIRLILPDGTPETVSRCHRPDIFFALTGGGPNTFGVLTEMTYTTHEIVPVQEYTLDYGNLDLDNARKFFNILVQNANRWGDRGWGGYIATQKRGKFVTLVNPVLSLNDSKEDMAPLTEFAKNLSSINIVISKTWSSWDAYFQDHFMPLSVHPASSSASVASRLVPTSFFNEDRDGLVDALLDLHYTPSLTLWIMLVTPRRHHDAFAYSLHPAWRCSTWLIRVNTNWDQYYQGATPNTNRGMFKVAHEALEPLRRLIPDTAVSMSEADIWEPRHEDMFWGKERYEKLRKIKREVDPTGTFVVYQGVGWEEAPAERWKCYPKK